MFYYVEFLDELFEEENVRIVFMLFKIILQYIDINGKNFFDQ